MQKTIPIRRPASGVEDGDRAEPSPTDKPADNEDDQVDGGSRLGLQFVAETGVTRPKGTLREIIRSQARRKRSNRTHSSPSKRQSAVSRASKHADKETDSTSPDSTSPGSTSSDPQTSLTIRNGLPHPESGPSGKAFDPFRTLPIEESGDFHALFRRFELISHPQCHAFSCAIPKEAIIKFAISDAALLHALAHSALSIGNTGPSASREQVYHGGQAIHHVNKRIANSTVDKPIDDGTMFTVGCLTHFEVRSSSTKSVKMHLDGLEALVESRGGIHALDNSASDMTMKFIYWTDAVGSIALDTKPRFELVALPSHQQNPADLEPYSHLALRYTTKLCNLTGLTDISQETIDVYWGLRNLAAFKDLVSAYEATITLEFHSYVGRLVSRLVRIVHHDVSSSPNQNGLIFRLFGNAALVHVVMFIRDTVTPMHHPFSELLSARIRRNVETIDISSFQLQYPEMMLWILIVGGLGSSIGTKSKDNQRWFAKSVAKACLAQGIARTDEIPFFLTEFFWTALYLHSLCTEFWNDVAMALKGVTVVDLTTSETPPASAE